VPRTAHTHHTSQFGHEFLMRLRHFLRNPSDRTTSPFVYGPTKDPAAKTNSAPGRSADEVCMMRPTMGLLNWARRDRKLNKVGAAAGDQPCFEIFPCTSARASQSFLMSSLRKLIRN